MGGNIVMDISVLIPWRTDHGERERLFDWVLPRWLAAGVNVVIGSDDGPDHFNVSRAFNDAFEQSSTPAVILYGADHIPDPDKVAECAMMLEMVDWVAGYASTASYSKDVTDDILNGADYHKMPFCDVFGFCTGIIALRREVYAAIGGMDERFNGWGCEDTALRAALATCYPNTAEPKGIARALFHQKADRVKFFDNEKLIKEEYEPGVGNPPRMWASLHRAQQYRASMGTLGSSR